ncbi:MAG: 5-(carboxyamino)imidazole ribonucleotide mutase [Candidatus Eisenbacteria sp.]|nr:5-(carboxyamino)imidazole ribonucleotide mutase [Candidatus Eisenbacteria bacterium]
MKPVVGIVLGSRSDVEVVQPAMDLLDEFGVAHEIVVSSAHRQPERTRRYAAGAEKKGLKILIAAAGLAAHLPGVLASHTTLPVLGVPVPASTLGGLDSLLSIVQMPGGIPVGTLGIGGPGAKNAALLAVQILALHDRRLKNKLQAYRQALKRIRSST